MWESGSGTRGFGRPWRPGWESWRRRCAPGGTRRSWPGARLELLTVSPAARGLGRRGGRPLRDGAAARHGRAAGPGPQRPPGRELRHLPRDTLTFSSLEGTGCAWPSSGSWSPWAGRWWSSRSWCSPSLPAPPPCPFWPPRALCCSWVCRRRSCRRGSAPRCEACKTAPEPSSSGAVHPAEKTFRLDARLFEASRKLQKVV